MWGCQQVFVSAGPPRGPWSGQEQGLRLSQSGWPANPRFSGCGPWCLGDQCVCSAGGQEHIRVSLEPRVVAVMDPRGNVGRRGVRDLVPALPHTCCVNAGKPAPSLSFGSLSVKAGFQTRSHFN